MSDFSMWSEPPSKYVPVSSEDDRLLLYGDEELVKGLTTESTEPLLQVSTENFQKAQEWAASYEGFENVDTEGMTHVLDATVTKTPLLVLNFIHQWKQDSGWGKIELELIWAYSKKWSRAYLNLTERCTQGFDECLNCFIEQEESRGAWNKQAKSTHLQMLRDLKNFPRKAGSAYRDPVLYERIKKGFDGIMSIFSAPVEMEDMHTMYGYNESVEIPDVNTLDELADSWEAKGADHTYSKDRDVYVGFVKSSPDKAKSVTLEIYPQQSQKFRVVYWRNGMQSTVWISLKRVLPDELDEAAIIPKLGYSELTVNRQQKIKEALIFIQGAYREFIQLFKVVEPEEMHAVWNYNEAAGKTVNLDLPVEDTERATEAWKRMGEDHEVAFVGTDGFAVTQKSPDFSIEFRLDEENPIQYRPTPRLGGGTHVKPKRKRMMSFYVRFTHQEKPKNKSGWNPTVSQDSQWFMPCATLPTLETFWSALEINIRLKLKPVKEKILKAYDDLLKAFMDAPPEMEDMHAVYNYNETVEEDKKLIDEMWGGYSMKRLNNPPPPEPTIDGGEPSQAGVHAIMRAVEWALSLPNSAKNGDYGVTLHFDDNVHLSFRRDKDTEVIFKLSFYPPRSTKKGYEEQGKLSDGTQNFADFVKALIQREKTRMPPDKIKIYTLEMMLKRTTVSSGYDEVGRVFNGICSILFPVVDMEDMHTIYGYNETVKKDEALISEIYQPLGGEWLKVDQQKAYETSERLKDAGFNVHRGTAGEEGFYIEITVSSKIDGRDIYIYFVFGKEQTKIQFSFPNPAFAKGKASLSRIDIEEYLHTSDTTLEKLLARIGPDQFTVKKQNICAKMSKQEPNYNRIARAYKVVMDTVNFVPPDESEMHTMWDYNEAVAKFTAPDREKMKEAYHWLESSGYDDVFPIASGNVRNYIEVKFPYKNSYIQCEFMDVGAKLRFTFYFNLVKDYVLISDRLLKFRDVFNKIIKQQRRRRENHPKEEIELIQKDYLDIRNDPVYAHMETVYNKIVPMILGKDVPEMADMHTVWGYNESTELEFVDFKDLSCLKESTEGILTGDEVVIQEANAFLAANSLITNQQDYENAVKWLQSQNLEGLKWSADNWGEPRYHRINLSLPSTFFAGEILPPAANPNSVLWRIYMRWLCADDFTSFEISIPRTHTKEGAAIRTEADCVLRDQFTLDQVLDTISQYMVKKVRINHIKKFRQKETNYGRLSALYENITKRLFATPPEMEDMHTVYGYNESTEAVRVGDYVVDGHDLTKPPEYGKVLRASSFNYLIKWEDGKSVYYPTENVEQYVKSGMWKVDHTPEMEDMHTEYGYNEALEPQETLLQGITADDLKRAREEWNKKGIAFWSEGVGEQTYVVQWESPELIKTEHFDRSVRLSLTVRFNLGRQTIRVKTGYAAEFSGNRPLKEVTFSMKNIPPTFPGELVEHWPEWKGLFEVGYDKIFSVFKPVEMEDMHTMWGYNESTAPFKKTVKAYKLFKTKPGQPGKIFPLFVLSNEAIPIGQWVKAQSGPAGKTAGRVASKLGDLAYRPGFHAGDLPVALHIGGKSKPGPKPDFRPDDQVWAEVEFPDDVDWQKIANANARITKAGKPHGASAHVTDQVPFGGYYRYKTNPNMVGNWLISGDMKIDRILSNDEVKAINKAAGVADLPRKEDLVSLPEARDPSEFVQLTNKELEEVLNKLWRDEVPVFLSRGQNLGMDEIRIRDPQNFQLVFEVQRNRQIKDPSGNISNYLTTEKPGVNDDIICYFSRIRFTEESREIKFIFNVSQGQLPANFNEFWEKASASRRQHEQGLMGDISFIDARLKEAPHIIQLFNQFVDAFNEPVVAPEEMHSQWGYNESKWSEEPDDFPEPDAEGFFDAQEWALQHKKQFVDAQVKNRIYIKFWQGGINNTSFSLSIFQKDFTDAGYIDNPIKKVCRFVFSLTPDRNDIIGGHIYINKCLTHGDMTFDTMLMHTPESSSRIEEIKKSQDYNDIAQTYNILMEKIFPKVVPPEDMHTMWGYNESDENWIPFTIDQFFKLKKGAKVVVKRTLYSSPKKFELEDGVFVGRKIVNARLLAKIKLDSGDVTIASTQDVGHHNLPPEPEDMHTQWNYNENISLLLDNDLLLLERAPAGEPKVYKVGRGASEKLEQEFKEMSPREQQMYVAQKVKEKENIPGAVPYKAMRSEQGFFLHDTQGNPMWEKTEYNMGNLPILGRKQLKYANSKTIAKQPDLFPNQFPYLKPIDRKRLSYLEANGATRMMAGLIQQAYETEMVHIADVMAGSGWYTRMTQKLRRAFGGDAEIFAQLLGATSARTPVRDNFLQALDAYDQLKAHKFDRHIQKYLEAYEHLSKKQLRKHLVEAGITKELPKSEAAAMAMWIDHHDILPKRSNEKKFNANSNAVLKVLAQKWLQLTKSPKTPNFAGNLTGRIREATIDVWAARFVHELGHKNANKPWLIQPGAETPVRPLDFAFAQRAFRIAADNLRDANGMPLQPDDLQAICWYYQKHVWELRKYSRGAATSSAKKASFDETFDKIFSPTGERMSDEELTQAFAGEPSEETGDETEDESEDE